jgi:MbtH protein
MTNPFEDEDRTYQVLVNNENQHSLWPEWLPVPAGWHVAFGPAARKECLDYIDENWRDMRPRSLAESMDAN